MRKLGAVEFGSSEAIYFDKILFTLRSTLLEEELRDKGTLCCLSIHISTQFDQSMDPLKVKEPIQCDNHCRVATFHEVDIDTFCDFLELSFCDFISGLSVDKLKQGILVIGW